MKRKYVRTMTALAATVVLGSALFTACSSKKNESSTDVEGQNITQEPSDNKNEEPTKAAEDAVAQPEAGDTKATEAPVEGTSDPAKLDISVSYDTKDEVITDDENKDVTLVTIKRNQPVVTIPNNEAASKKINDYFAALNDTFQDQKAEYKSEAKDLHKEWSNDGMSEWTGYDIECSFNMERADENCISFSADSYYDLLGAHPSSELNGYTFDTKTGELLTIEDITSDTEKFKQQVNDKILEYCQQAEKEQGEQIFMEGYEEEIPNILQPDTWYFDDKGFEVIANEYSIAPHAYGIFSVLIPYNELSGVKDEFIKK